MKSTEELLRLVLRETYGGPSLSYENGLWVIYRWYDAPVCTDIIARGTELRDVARRAADTVTT